MLRVVVAGIVAASVGVLGGVVPAAVAADGASFDIDATFENPTLRAQNGGDATGPSYTWFDFRVDWSVPDGSEKGQTFGLVIPDTLEAQSNEIVAYAGGDDVLPRPAVATCDVSQVPEPGGVRKGGLVTCTLTDFVTSNWKDIGGELFFRVSSAKDLEQGTYAADFTNGNTSITETPPTFTITADTAPGEPTALGKYGWVDERIDVDGQRYFILRWVITIPANRPSGVYVMDPLPDGFAYIPGSLETTVATSPGTEWKWASSVEPIQEDGGLRFTLNRGANQHTQLKFNVRIPANVDVRYFDEFANQYTLLDKDNKEVATSQRPTADNSYYNDGKGSGKAPEQVFVGDYVWLDADRNGTQDDNEAGIEGVKLSLSRTDSQPIIDVLGNEVTDTVTDGSGHYLFEHLPILPDGEKYVVTIDSSSTALEGLSPTKETPGGDREKDSSTGSAEAIELPVSGVGDLSLDFGFVTPNGKVSVGDFVWEDTDGDGIQDEGEPGIPGVTLTLVGPDGKPVKDINGTDVAPATTDENGTYSFADLPVLKDGESYTVAIDKEASAEALSGLSPTTAGAGNDPSKDSSTDSATSTGLTKDGDNDPTLDFGFVKGKVSVGDYVWYDTNRDGIQDEGEPGIAGVTLTLTGPGIETSLTTTTDSNGAYSFDNLPTLKEGQSYTVTVTDPEGYQPTVAGAGDDRGADSSTGSAASTGLTNAGDRDPSLDFGFVGSVSVGDFVWLDTNADGRQDKGEPGIAGVTLTLTGPDGGQVTDVNGTVVAPTTTDADGKYTFENLPVLADGQTYTVTVTDPQGFVPTKSGEGERTGDSSTGTSVTDNEQVDLRVPGTRDDTLDFGYVPVVSVGDFVWSDTNSDGIQDEGEPGIPGVVLTLVGPEGKPVKDLNGTPVESTVTDENGAYSFDNLPVLPAGEHYTVKVTTPDGFVPTKAGAGNDRGKDSSTDFAESVDLTQGGQRDDTLDFGFAPMVSVGDYVWLDVNRDGIQDDGEPGLEGVELTLTGPDGKPVTGLDGKVVAPVKTDKDGKYSFDNLPVLAEGQSYTVTVEDPAGYQPTVAEAGDDRTVDSSTGSAQSTGLTQNGQRDPSLDFGYVRGSVSVGDRVWSDTNGDGIQDDGEPGIPGVTLTLVGPDGKPVTDVNGEPVEPTTTDENGIYDFSNLPMLPQGKSYTVKVTDPSGYAPTKPGQGDDRAKDSSTGEESSGDLTNSGDRDDTLDFGFVPTVSVGDYVWYDLNGDGVQNDGEPGIEGVELTLTGPDGKPVTDVNGNPVKSVKTDEKGLYTFDGLPVLKEGESYTVSVTTPEGYTSTTPNVGDRATDSDTESARSQGLTNPGERDDTLDFGFQGAVSVGDRVWVDRNDNGIQDEGEPGLPGVELTLVGPDGQPVTDVNGNPVAPVTTDADGAYTFANLPVLAEGESYEVRVGDAPDGFTPAKPGQGNDRAKDSSTGAERSQGLNKPGDRDETLDFGFVPTGKIGDFIWFDTDRDGIQDEGEAGVPGVVIELVDKDGKAVLDDEGNPRRATTDENGFYFFDVPPGTWSVKIVEIPAGYGFTAPNAGDDASDSDATGLNVPFASVTTTFDNLTNFTLDAGLVAVVSVGDFVWSDSNADGIQDEGEPGIPGVVLTVYGPDGAPARDAQGQIVAPVTTDANGKYLFENLPVLEDGQSYTVKIDRDATAAANPAFAKFIPTSSHTTTRDLDSDEWQVSSQGLTTPGSSDLTLDFGFIATTPSVLIEKFDINGNDADTVADTARTSDDSQKITFRITNNGDEALTNVSVTDKVVAGSAKVENLVCELPDGSTGTTWTGTLAPGASFECSATVTGLVIDEQHTDIATVTAEGVVSGKTVESNNPYNVIRVAELPRTGGESNLYAAGLALVLLMGGGALLFVRRRALLRNE